MAYLFRYVRAWSNRPISGPGLILGRPHGDLRAAALNRSSASLPGVEAAADGTRLWTPSPIRSEFLASLESTVSP